MLILLCWIVVLPAPFIAASKEISECGKISSAQLSTKQEVKLPWAVHLVNTDESLGWAKAHPYPGILISPTLIFMSARAFYPGSPIIKILQSPYAYLAKLSDNTTANVSHISLHPKRSNFSECNISSYEFVLVHLSSPVPISNTVQPICIHGFNYMATQNHSDHCQKNSKTNCLFGLRLNYEWTLKTNNYSLSYSVPKLNEYSVDACEANIINNSGSLIHRIPEGLECANKSEESIAKPQMSDGVVLIPMYSSVFYCTNTTCFLKGQPVNVLDVNVRPGCSHPLDSSRYYMWPLTESLVDWIKNNEKCGPGNFTCYSDGKCIDKSKRCDLIPDCLDSSDENLEYCTSPLECTLDEFRCRIYGKCIPKSKIGDGNRDCLDGEDEDELKNRNLMIAILSAFFVFAVAAGVVYFSFRIQRLKKQIRDLTEEEVNEFFKGSQRNRVPSLIKNDEQHNEYDFPLYINSKLLEKPWNDSLEIAAKHLQLGDVLGQGEFGIVYKANLKSIYTSNGQTIYGEVAVKTQLPNMTVEDFKNLLREVKIMSTVGYHECIVSFIGASTQYIKKRHVYLVMELCTNGNLLGFLKALKKDNMNISDSPDRQSIKAFTDGKIPFLSELLKWAIQIARGMSHLENKNVIHGDLAARNILLTTHLNAKISDFGLSRELDDTNIYIKSTQQPIPWKWLALESFNSRIFSHKTDVWAYGVTIWEVFSLGENPYDDIPFSQDFVNLLQKGNRLLCPQFASTEIYDIMLNTWNADPEKRPSFSSLEILFLNLQETANTS